MGIYCQDTAIACGSYAYCQDVADVAGTCEGSGCQSRKMVKTAVAMVYVMSAAGVVVDVIDLILCVALADNVLFKSVTNVVAALVKLLAFGALVGVGTQGFLTTFSESECFNADGAATLDQAFSVFQSCAGLLFASAMFSLILVPISALHGGRLLSKPTYQLEVLDLGG